MTDLLTEDEVLIRLLKHSDQGAFRMIYERYWKYLFVTAYRKTRSKAVAEELTQAIFASLWEHRETVAILHLKNYLATALKYRVINYLRRQVVSEQYLLAVANFPGEEVSADAHLHFNELSGALQKAIDTLPEKTRQVFTMSRYHHLPIKEIAASLDLSEKSVEYHITRSLKRLRILLKDFLALLAAGGWVLSQASL